jgi:hypothetical protein
MEEEESFVPEYNVSGNFYLTPKRHALISLT